jgi:TorA maturation chaperone TorD
MNSTPETDSIQRTDLAEARMNTYAYLSQAFLSEPTEELVSGFTDEALISGLPEGEQDDDTHPLRRFAASYEGDIDSLVQDFEALFVVPIRGAYVAPFASVFLTGMVGQEPTRAVKRFYQEAGLEVEEGFAEAPDHVGMELEFMAMLCLRETTGLKADDEQEVRNALTLERRFLRDHVLPWIPQLSEEILIKGTTDFYKGVSRFMKDYVTFDMNLVDDLLEDREE